MKRAFIYLATITLLIFTSYPIAQAEPTTGVNLYVSLLNQTNEGLDFWGYAINSPGQHVTFKKEAKAKTATTQFFTVKTNLPYAPKGSFAITTHDGYSRPIYMFNYGDKGVSLSDATPGVVVISYAIHDTTGKLLYWNAFIDFKSLDN